MAKTVRYTGLSGIREIGAADFKNVGVEDQGLIRVAGANLHNNRKNLPREVEVSDAAAAYLVEHEDFELVEDARSTTSEPSGDQVEPVADPAPKTTAKSKQ